MKNESVKHLVLSAIINENSKQLTCKNIIKRVSNNKIAKADKIEFYPFLQKTTNSRYDRDIKQYK